MYEILGFLNFNGNPSLLTEKYLLPSQRNWAHSPVKRIKAVNFEAIYLEHENSLQCYAYDSSQAILILGEPRLRLDAVPIPGFHTVPGELLSASAIFEIAKAGGPLFQDKIKGNYSIILVNLQDRTARVINSRFGISPFYYAWSNGLFVFSTSLASAAAFMDTSALDPAAIVEQSLFNYPLGRRTYFKNISMLLPAECLEVNASGISRKIYWDVSSLYSSDVYPRQKALDLGSELFYKITNDYAGTGPIRVSFTSGFDSRAIMAVLNKPVEQIQAYSFGIPGSLNVDIPTCICRENGIPFEPIILDECYEQVYAEYATRAILLSDCYSTVERANYPYAFERLAGFSPVVLTGLFGSELMRTFQNVGSMIGAGVTSINKAANIPTGIDEVLLNSKPRYLQETLFNEAKEEIREDLLSLFERFTHLPIDRRFYVLLLTEILRKYFGPELQLERTWGITRFPFLDDEFVEFAFHAPFAGVYSRTLTPTIQNRFNSQYFYSYIIQRFNPKLLPYLTDHGYSPADVLSPLGVLWVGPNFMLRRAKRRLNNYREFKTNEWTELIYKQRLLPDYKDSEFFTGMLEQDFQSKTWLEHQSEFARAGSLKMWLSLIGQG